MIICIQFQILSRAARVNWQLLWREMYYVPLKRVALWLCAQNYSLIFGKWATRKKEIEHIAFNLKYHIITFYLSEMLYFFNFRRDLVGYPKAKFMGLL